MRKEWDMVDTRLDWVVSQTLCGCEEEEMCGLTFAQGSQKVVPPQHMEHLEICEYIVLMFPTSLASFSNPFRHNEVIWSVMS